MWSQLKWSIRPNMSTCNLTHEIFKLMMLYKLVFLLHVYYNPIVVTRLPWKLKNLMVTTQACRMFALGGPHKAVTLRFLFRCLSKRRPPFPQTACRILHPCYCNCCTWNGLFSPLVLIISLWCLLFVSQQERLQTSNSFVFFSIQLRAGRVNTDKSLSNLK